MTVQEIQEIGFEKAVFGGYDMQSVDTFLERVAEEFAAMQKENAALKAKMKVLVDKIEEYRGVEEGMRRTLMSAQTIAQDTIDKAKQEAEQMIANAQDETENKIRATKDEIALEEKKLEIARKSTAEFIAHVSASFQAQTKALVDLAKGENMLRSVEEAAQQVMRGAEVPMLSQDAQLADSSDSDMQVVANAEKADAPSADATRKIDFGDLKFGADYDPKKV